MKEGKIILTALVVLGTAAGVLAFKASSFTDIQAYKMTNTIFTFVPGRTYTATIVAGDYCTTIPTFVTDEGSILDIAIVTTRLPAPRFITFTAINGSTVARLVPFCTSIFTFTTIDF
jgi:hypothetical protein